MKGGLDTEELIFLRRGACCCISGRSACLDPAVGFKEERGRPNALGKGCSVQIRYRSFILEDLYAKGEIHYDGRTISAFEKRVAIWVGAKSLGVTSSVQKRKGWETRATFNIFHVLLNFGVLL
jgi:hypothetical protein